MNGDKATWDMEEEIIHTINDHHLSWVYIIPYYTHTHTHIHHPSCPLSGGHSFVGPPHVHLGDPLKSKSMCHHPSLASVEKEETILFVSFSRFAAKKRNKKLAQPTNQPNGTTRVFGCPQVCVQRIPPPTLQLSNQEEKKRKINQENDVELAFLVCFLCIFITSIHNYKIIYYSLWSIKLATLHSMSFFF